MKIKLTTFEDTELLGRALAGIFRDCVNLRVMLLRGDLGSGKTTLVSAIVRNFEGAETAEVCSPSFTICNMYGTEPPVAHCDLYRTGGITDEIWDLLEDQTCVKMIEWAEYLPDGALPVDYMDIRMQSCDTGKLTDINVVGRHKTEVFAVLGSVFSPDNRKG